MKLLVGGFVGLLLFAIILSTLFFSFPSSAHSGRTDSNGGHNCNVGSCAGTYHYHNGGGYEPEEPNYYDEGFTNGNSHAEREESNIVSLATVDAENDGSSDGESDDGSSYYGMNMSSTCEKDFTFDGYSPEEYQDAYSEGFYDVCSSIYERTYESVYDTAYEEAHQEYIELAEAESEAEELAVEESNDSDLWNSIVSIGVFFGALFGIGYIIDLVGNRKK